jgi:hypothetical protein
MGKKKGKKVHSPDNSPHPNPTLTHHPPQGPPEKKSPFNLLTLEELEEQVPKMEAALPEKQAARNYAQVERDAVKRYFGVAQRDTDDVTTAAVATDKAIETLIEQHRVELEVYKQKVRHLSYQHTIEMENRAEKDRARHAADHDTHLDRMQRWEGQKTSLEGEIQDQEKTTGADAERLGKQNQLALTRMKEAFTAGLERFEDVCAARLDRQREELELRRRVGLHEAEEFNAAHVNALVAQHKTSLDEMKEYYRGVTAQNVSLITAYVALRRAASGDCCCCCCFCCAARPPAPTIRCPPLPLPLPLPLYHYYYYHSLASPPSGTRQSSPSWPTGPWRTPRRRTTCSA